ncbi:MAG: ImmA/IrrE family metallo-endopeptidase [Candidatus Binataceae bacterium]
MPSEAGFERFGRPDRFALDLRLLQDPDGDDAAPVASVGSWGQWRLWVSGLNLMEHDLALDSGKVARQDHVTWYLAPLLRWLAAVWTPLLHEERFPTPARRARDARSAYLSVGGTQMDNAEAFAPWQEWAARHGLRWSAEGGLLPDAFLRRVGDDIEVSWGERWQPGGEAAEYVIEPGVTHCDVADVAQALDAALTWAVRQPTLRARAWHQLFRRRVAARPQRGGTDTPLAWYLDGKSRPGRLTRLFRERTVQFGAKQRRLLNSAFNAHAITQISPAAAMFGALSPKISEGGVITLLAIATASLEITNNERPVEQHVRNSPAWRSIEPWEDGYRLALDLLEELNLIAQASPFDLEHLLEQWQVERREAALDQDGPLGVALAGPNLAPTIVVNRDHSMNHHDHGKRFTIAHELCHLLYDRDRARRVAHSSTQWAPLAVEQRANAFAAMLLMPPGAVQATFQPRRKRASLSDVSEMARTLRVGLRAAIQHLANLGQITDDDRARLLDEAVEAGSAHVSQRASA